MSDTRRPRGGGFSPRASLRQLRYPSAFRIAAPSWPAELHEALARIEALRERAHAEPPAPASPETEAPAPEKEAAPPPVVTRDEIDDDAVVEAAMGLWRVARRLQDASGGDAQKLARSVRNHMDKAWEGLKRMGVEVEEHNGQPYDSGLTLTPVAFEPGPGLQRETIVETTRPTIYRTGRRIQDGEVVVGQPEGHTTP